MATQQSIDHLVGLAVAMLGVAPGTDWLNARAKQLDGGATLADIANEIQSSSAFEDEYPAFLTNERFAKDFLEALLGDHVDDAVMTAAVDFVAGQLAGASRGELALALVSALTIIGGEGGSEADMAFRALHSGNFGKAAEAFHNKVMVAKHYTEEARMEDPSSSVLEGVTDAAESVTAAINLINNPPAPPEQPATGEVFQLTPLRDNYTGTDQGDTIIAEPVLAGASGVFQQTLQPFDRIDGGEGVDTLEIYDVSALRDFTISNADVSNVENVVVYAQKGIIADMSDWEGIETIDLKQFDGDINVTVPGIGLVVSGNQSRAGDVTVIGAAGAVEWDVGARSAVTIGSAGHTTSVKVEGGESVTVHNGAGRPSETVTSVSIDGVNPDSTPDPTTDDDDDTDGVQNQIVVSAPTTAIHSNAIESVSLANTFGTVLIENKSGEAEDLMLTLDGYGGQYINPATRKATDPFAALPVAGRIHLTGDGAAENVKIEMAGNSRIDLASNVVKSITVMGAGSLNLDVNEFNADNPDIRPTQSLETITVTGKAGVTSNLIDHDDLKTVDASASMGNNSFSSSTGRSTESLDSLVSVSTGSGGDSVSLGAGGPAGKLESVGTGDGDDSVTIVGTHRGKGITVDLGVGDDSYHGTADNRNSRIDAGEGRDTLRLDHGTGSTNEDADGEDQSIYTGFEVLDIRGGGSGKYNLDILGIEEIIATGSTLNTAEPDDDPVYGPVVLEEVAGGTPIHVSGRHTAWKGGNADTRGTDTTVKLSYELSEDATAAGTLIGGSSASILNVSLTATGGSSDSKERGKVQLTGQASLEVTALDTNIRGIVIDSKATLHPRPREGKDADKMEVEGKNLPGVGNYENTFILREGIGNNAPSSVREVEITGESKLNFSGGAFASLELVDASKNSAGVTVNVTNQMGAADADGVTMYGGAKVDKLTGGARADKLFGNGGKDVLVGGAGNDELTGGAAADTLTGGANADKFRIGTSDSTLGGFDTIKDFGTGGIGDDGDQILLSRSLYNRFEGGVKTATANLGVRPSDAKAWSIDSSDRYTGADDDRVLDQNDNTYNSLTEFLASESDGLFEQRTEDAGSFDTVTKHSVAIVEEVRWVDRKIEDVTGVTNREKDNIVQETSDAGNEVTYHRWVFIDVNGNGDFDAGADMVIALDGTGDGQIITSLTIGADAFGAITS